MRDLKREMEFEGLIMSDHKCEISVLPYSRLGRLTYPKVSSIIISVYAKGNHPELWVRRFSPNCHPFWRSPDKKKPGNMQIRETHLRSGLINIFAIEAPFIVNIKKPEKKVNN